MEQDNKSIKVNTDIIRNIRPCEEEFEDYFQHYNDFDGTLLEFLDLEKITSKDKVWVAVRLLPKDKLTAFAFDMAFMAADIPSYTTYIADHDAAPYAAEAARYAINTYYYINDPAYAARAAYAAYLAYAAANAYASADAAAAAYAAYSSHAAYGFFSADDIYNAEVSAATAARHTAWDNAVESIRYLVSEEGL